LGGRKGIRPVKKQWWGAGMVICLEQGGDLHMAQLMPLPLTVSFFSKIQFGFTFLVPAHLDSPGKRAVKQVCVCVGSIISVFRFSSTFSENKHLGISGTGFFCMLDIFATVNTKAVKKAQSINASNGLASRC